MIFGLGDFAKVVGNLLGAKRYTVHREFIPENPDVEVVPYEDLGRCDLLIAVGYRDLNKARKRIYEDAIKRGHWLLEFHEDAIGGKVKLGDNTNNFIFNRNEIQPFVELGKNIVLWSGNHIGHHAKIGSHCFITSHCVISGRADIGERCFLGVNCSVLNNVKIGEGCIIQAGSVVDRDLPPNSVWTRNGLSKVLADRVKL